jgi:hypothetical protein
MRFQETGPRFSSMHGAAKGGQLPDVWPSTATIYGGSRNEFDPVADLLSHNGWTFGRK